MIFFAIYFVVNLFANLAMGSETQPTGDQLMWEFVNCFGSDGSQSQEVWGYQYGHLPGLNTGPDEAHLIHIGGSYYYEGQVTSWTDSSGTPHKAYIFPNADSDNDGPQGIQVSTENTGLWAWYGSGDSPRIIGSNFNCHSVYWTMQLPHAILQTSFTGTQGICAYQTNFQGTMSSLSLDSDSLTHGGMYSFTDTKLYAQRGCCSGSCCGCPDSCGGELGNTVNVALTGRQGELDTMLGRLAIDGNALSSSAPCNCYCPDNGCPFPGFGNIQCPNQPPPGENIPQNGWVGTLYGPFTDGSGKWSINNGGNAYIQYQLYEQPPTDCAGGIIGMALSLLESSALAMLTGGFAAEGIVGILAEAGTDATTLALQCAGVST